VDAATHGDADSSASNTGTTAVDTTAAAVPFTTAPPACAENGWAVNGVELVVAAPKSYEIQLRPQSQSQLTRGEVSGKAKSCRASPTISEKALDQDCMAAVVVDEPSRSLTMDPRYQAPEALKEAHSVSEATDAYAFGSLVFEVLDQVAPWQGIEDAHVIERSLIIFIIPPAVR